MIAIPLDTRRTGRQVTCNRELDVLDVLRLAARNLRLPWFPIFGLAIDRDCLQGAQGVGATERLDGFATRLFAVCAAAGCNWLNASNKAAEIVLINLMLFLPIDDR